MEKNAITVPELQHKLEQKEPVFILDVRPAAERREWMIAGSVHVDAYRALNASDEAALDIVEIPRNVTVVTVCAAGRTSLLGMELLRRKGIQAYSLEGGMKAWNYAFNKAELDLPDGTRVIQVRRAAKGVLSYIVASHGEAIVIDAALDPQVYVDLAAAYGWIIRYVMDTHIHADYVSRSPELARLTGAKHLLISDSKVDFEFIPIGKGQSIQFGKSHLQFLHTPGHTWESTTFILGDHIAAFTGDTLFVDGVGRPDLKAEHSETIERAKSLYKSVNTLLSMDPSLLVLPAHASDAIPFDSTLIGDTIMNIGMKIPQVRSGEDVFVDYVLSRIPPTPPNYLTIGAINRAGVHHGQPLADLEAGGNHCAIA